MIRRITIFTNFKIDHMKNHTKENFPYISRIKVNNCFAFQNIDLTINDSIGLKHLILTGKNGSGKTTILESLAHVILQEYITGNSRVGKINELKGTISANQKHPQRKIWETEIDLLERTENFPQLYVISTFPFDTSNVVFSYFKANRKVELAEVSTITKEDSVITKINDLEFATLFKQFLVNKKVYQAFSMLDSNKNETYEHETFFNLFENTLKRVFDDKNIILSFSREEFEFYISTNNMKRKINFNQLSSGFSSYLNIIMDLMIRVDIIRKNLINYSYEPCGIVLIDEPENHLHIQMQYEILPLLTELFPNLQFIIASHSPAVISSIKNVTIYDLSTANTLDESAVGSSYSELMVTHFNVKNEYSNIADDIIKRAKEILFMNEKSQALIDLKNLIFANERYISPILKLDLESYVLKLERELI